MALDGDLGVGGCSILARAPCAGAGSNELGWHGEEGMITEGSDKITLKVMFHKKSLEFFWKKKSQSL